MQEGQRAGDSLPVRGHRAHSEAAPAGESSAPGGKGGLGRTRGSDSENLSPRRRPEAVGHSASERRPPALPWDWVAAHAIVWRVKKGFEA